MNLLGRDMSGMMPETILLNNGLLHDLNMGYEKAERIRPGHSVRYNRVESAYVHPWSYENVGEQYGMNRLSDYIPIRDYMELPQHAVDRIVSGIIKGKDERLKLEEQKRKEKEAKDKVANTSNVHGSEMDPVTAELLRQMEQDNHR